MTRRSVLVVLAALAGAVFLLRRRKGAAARVDVYYEDGSMLSLERGTPQADRMLALAADALAATRAA
ncbi:MAG TPA: hypothetical protein VGQ15_04465 [Gaiellaceae bacterium]|jgi:hypothetical protein|nr:hypothetical protein [Gaiellaceae bacterium]